MKFSHIFLFVFVIIGYNVSAFTPKVNSTNTPQSLFIKHGKDFQILCFEKHKDPILLEMAKISRENIKNLPDIVDFGNITSSQAFDSEKINKYKIYNYVFEGVTINAGLEFYGTLDSISVFPNASTLGNYSSDIIFKWQETDPITNIIKEFTKTLIIKANIVENIIDNENITGLSNSNNQIKEIWYENSESLTENINTQINDFNLVVNGLLNLKE